MNVETWANPTPVALGLGLIIWLGRTVWDRTTGAKDEKSLPLQLREIDAKLVELNLKLEILITKHSHTDATVEELKTDFWGHMRDYHGGSIHTRKMSSRGVSSDV